MSKAKLIYQANQEVIGKHLKSKEWIVYLGELTIYERKINPVILKLKREVCDSFIEELMDEQIEFKGNSVSYVYGKLSNWYYKNGIIFKK